MCMVRWQLMSAMCKEVLQKFEESKSSLEDKLHIGKQLTAATKENGIPGKILSKLI